MRCVVLIASYLEPELVERIRGLDPRIDVLFEPELLAPPRYHADHTGHPFTRTAEQEARWLSLLARADVLFDFDKSHVRELSTLAPGVRWIQATSSGIGEFVRTAGYATSMPNTVFTTAAGVHAQPLAEFCVLVMLSFHRKLFSVKRDQQRKHWERFASTDLRGQTLVVVGVGRVGKEVARMGQTFGMRVVGVKRSTVGVVPADLHLDVLYGPADLPRALAEAQNLVLIAPHTAETARMIGAVELAMLPSGAVFINIGRGALVDESALVDALRSGHLLGAGLDVFEQEPLPQSSPLWEMDNVIVCSHSASTTDGENARITELFCENLRRYLAGSPLLNVFDTARGF
ncbi:MAG: D-2-hydroxyacid dehydrogenase [Gemmatimonadetes bacterium]|nr:D-2-hydroxyacid dehydrogenase [Gemmatimonadota bacterium]